jgi:hypothetical protein
MIRWWIWEENEDGTSFYILIEIMISKTNSYILSWNTSGSLGVDSLDIWISKHVGVETNINKTWPPTKQVGVETNINKTWPPTKQVGVETNINKTWPTTKHVRVETNSHMFCRRSCFINVRLYSHLFCRRSCFINMTSDKTCGRRDEH